jgi:hypothetical protein
MNLSHAFRHVVENARSYGPSAALHDLRQRAVNRVVPFQILRGMTAVLPDVKAALFDPGHFTARFARPLEILACAQADHGMSLEFAEEALARGDECFALFDGGRVASYGWYSRQPTHISDGLVLHFDPDWVYMYKGYTDPAYRGQRLHGIGMSLALRSYTERRARGLISYVKSNNFQSLRSIERMGYRIFGDIYLARVLGKPVIWTTPSCKAYGFRVESAAARSTASALS